MDIPDLPLDIIRNILKERTEIMKEIKLDKLEKQSHLNFFNCMCELEENIDDADIYIQITIDNLENEIDEQYYNEVLSFNFSDILIESIIHNREIYC
jgi:hypothetical protein